MTTLLFTHPDCVKHDPGYGHPEAPARLGAVLAALEDKNFAGLIRREAPLGDEGAIARVHGASFATSVLAHVPRDGHAALDADTIVSPGSGKAALRAVGAVTAAVDAVMGGEVQNAFCAVRPPGHHAEPGQAMGFCRVNSNPSEARQPGVGRGPDR